MGRSFVESVDRLSGMAGMMNISVFPCFCMFRVDGRA